MPGFASSRTFKIIGFPLREETHRGIFLFAAHQPKRGILNRVKQDKRNDTRFPLLHFSDKDISIPNLSLAAAMNLQADKALLRNAGIGFCIVHGLHAI